jgi:hypothetical protein
VNLKRVSIRFDHKGPFFSGYRDTDGYVYILAPAPLPGQPSIQPPTSNGIYDVNTNPNAGYQYEISRSPQRIGAALSLPSGTCVDLNYSGFGNAGVDFYSEQNTGSNIFPNQNMPAVLLMFAADGHVDSVSFRTWDSSLGAYRFVRGSAPQGTTHVLVGRPEKVINFSGGAPPGPTTNLGDSNALWVSVGRLTGSVITTENAPNLNFQFSNPPTLAELRTFLTIAREYAITQDVKGAR